MIRFTGLLDVKMLLWVVPALVIPLLAIAVSCSGEPEVVVIDRTVVMIKEVKVVVEKVVVREVVVTATPIPTLAVPRPTPTAVANNKSVLFIDGASLNTDGKSFEGYTQLSDWPELMSIS